MISIVRRKCGIPINDVFFSDDPRSLAPCAPLQCFIQASTPLPGFVPFKTQVIDLLQTPAELFSKLSSSTRYKIRRAEREQARPTISYQPTTRHIRDFCQFYDRFARQKNRPLSNRAKLDALNREQALTIASAEDGAGAVVASHAYVTDTAGQRTRLLYSASHFRGSASSEERNFIGRANRLLHWFEIEQFKKSGFSRYDLGGVPIDDTDPEKNAIARFKSEFGGFHVIEFNGWLSPYPIISRLLPSLRRIFS